MSPGRARRAGATAMFVVAVLFLIAVLSEVFISDQLRPRSVFGYLFLTVLMSGIGGGLLLETMGVRILQ